MSLGEPQVTALLFLLSANAFARDTPGVDPGMPAADFDTAEGYGTGKIRGKDATITFKFIDAGEPGTGDSFDVTIATVDETIHVAGTIDGGNYQAHK